MNNLDSYHIKVLRTTMNGIYSIVNLVKALNMSPNTVVKKVNELLEDGYIERVNTVKYGGGNSPKIVCPTEEGKKLLELLAKGEFRSLHSKYSVLAGPLMTFSRLGIMLVGGRDIFTPQSIETPFYDVVVCDSYMFEDAIEENGLAYPRLENFIIWAIESRNPRFIAGIPLIFKEVKEIDYEYLTHLGAMRNIIGKLNFLLEIAGLRRYIDTGLKSTWTTSTMLNVTIATPDSVKKVARRYNVDNVPDHRLFKEMERLYGGNLKWQLTKRRTTS